MVKNYSVLLSSLVLIMELWLRQSSIWWKQDPPAEVEYPVLRASWPSWRRTGVLTDWSLQGERLYTVQRRMGLF